MLTSSEGSGYIYVGSECHVISPGSSLKRPHGKEPRSCSWTLVAQWLRCCATNRKVAGSIPAGVIGIFH